MIDLAAISDGLVLNGEGYWETRHDSSEVISYPPRDTDICFSVEESSFWFAHRNDVIAAAVKRIPPCGAILDVGSGNGFVAKGLVGHGHEVVAIEPSREGAVHAAKRGLANVVCGTLVDARFHAASLGGVGVFDVLEHINDDVAFLHAIRPLLMPRAPLYLTVPAAPSLWSVDDEAAGHFRRYVRRTLSTLFATAGFEILYLTHFFLPLVVPVALFRALPSKLGMRLPVDEHSIAREHGASMGMTRKLLLRLLASETRAVAAGYRLWPGTSILVIARVRGVEPGILTG